jgi:hypothetical protein
MGRATRAGLVRATLALAAIASAYPLGGGCQLDVAGTEADFAPPLDAGFDSYIADSAFVDVPSFVDAPNPCGANLSSDPANCGACSHVCGATNDTPSCISGICNFTCTAGFAHCSGDDKTGCETPVSGDGLNCGYCAHSCQGASCSASACQPIQLATTATRPYAIAVDAAHIFWTEASGAVMRAQLDGSAATPLATGQPTASFLALDATNVYWANQGSAAQSYMDGAVLMIGKDGTCGGVTPCPIKLYGSQYQPTGVGVSATDVFTSLPAFGAIVRIPLNRSAVAGISSTDQPFFVVADARDAYWGGLAGDLRQLVADAGVATTVDPAAGTPFGLALDDNRVYYADSKNDEVRAYVRDGGIAVVLAGGLPSPSYVAVDPTGVYFTATGASGQGDGVVGAMGTDGTCPPIWGGTCPHMLATARRFPNAIAVDDRFVYWADAEANLILKVAK